MESLTVYKQIKNKVLKMDSDNADKYITKMYNNGLLTVSQFAKLDDYIFISKIANK